MGATTAAGLLLVGGTAQVGGAVSQSQAMDAQGKYARQQYEFNARIADLQGEFAKERGARAESQVRRNYERVRGQQRAALAAGGVDVNSGSAAALQAETAELGELDAQTVKNNAWLEAWGYKVSAQDARSRGAYAEMAGKNAAGNTLLTGGLNFLTAGIGAATVARRWGGGRKLSDGWNEAGSGGMNYLD